MIRQIWQRLFSDYPPDLLPTFRNKLQWIFFGNFENVWLYGFCGEQFARKHKQLGNVQFVLWYVGDQKKVDGIGHTSNKWVDFDSTWWPQFQPTGKITMTIESRCCGRCDGVHDLCVTDMVCKEHDTQGCEICYGRRSKIVLK